MARPKKVDVVKEDVSKNESIETDTPVVEEVISKTVEIEDKTDEKESPQQEADTAEAGQVLREVEPKPTLAEYVAIWQERAEAKSLSMTAVKHPSCSDGAIFVGKYSGVRQVKSDELAAQFSSGEWFK